MGWRGALGIRWRVALLAAIVTGAGLGGCVQRLATYRYELQVVVDTPEGRRIGSTVREVRASIAPRLPNSGYGIYEEYVSEAAAVLLPNGRWLFALAPPRTAHVAFRPLVPEEISPDREMYEEEARVVRLMANKKLQTRLPRDLYPAFVTFRDRSDPNPVEEVDPDNLAASLGPGYRLAGMVVRTTDAPVTRRIRRLLPWLANPKNDILDPTATGFLKPEEKLSHRLYNRDFLQEPKQ